MSIRPLGIFSGASRRLIALAALVALRAAPSRTHAAHTPVEFLLPFVEATSVKCGDGTKFVVGIVASHFQAACSSSRMAGK